MAKDNSAELMQALIAKLYKTITGGDETLKMPRSKFVTWLAPGLPFKPEDFQYCATGFAAESAEEMRALYHNAFVVSRLFDLVPEVGAGREFLEAGMQQTVFTSTQDAISAVYGDTLRFSKVLDGGLTAEEEQKVKEFRELLVTQKEVVKSLVTKEKGMVSVPGPLVEAYNTYLGKYLDAADEYMSLLISAQTATGKDPEAVRRVTEWANKSKLLRKRVDAAYNDWVVQGYKNDYEEIAAYIEQVTARSMTLYKKDLETKLEAGKLTSPVDGNSDFYYTTLIPGTFAESPAWTRFTYYDGDFDAHSSSSYSQWGGGASLSFGLFSLGASASGSKREEAADQKSSNFRAELEFTQVPICRPWFEPGFFGMQGWTLQGSPFKGMLSDGGDPPTGRLVAYPVTALFVRNVRLTFDQAASTMKYASEQIQGGGRVGWGPFSVGGSYARGSESRSQSAHVEGGTVAIEGIQLIGLINNLVPRSPNPVAELKEEAVAHGG